MTPETVDLQEYGTSGPVALTPLQREKLLDAPLALHPARGFSGMFQITASSHVGALELPGLSIRIHPKLQVDRVMFLLSYAMGRMKFVTDDAGFEKDDDLFEAVVTGFAAQARRAFQPGLLQGYRSKEEALSTIRGRIRFEAQMRDRFGVAPPIEVRYDDFTVDIDENRIIRSAVERLRKLRIRSGRTRRELRSLRSRLSAVSVMEYRRREVPHVFFTRLNERYRPALGLARLILDATSPDLGRGTTTSPSFLIDMNEVFEDFVIAALRDRLRLREQDFPQGASKHPLFLDVGRRIKLKPDISWWRQDRCVFVGDVKYKKTRDGAGPNSDLYQLHAYATATNLPGGTLIYAAGEDEPCIHTVKHSGKKLQVVSLNLAGSPDEILREIAELARTIQADVPSESSA